MNEKKRSNDATDSALGYYFQAIYSILVLLDAEDDATVSVETKDDVELMGEAVRLKQIKHSVGVPPTFTEKDPGFWNTLGIWMPYISDSRCYFSFVTCAKLADGNDLAELRSEGNHDQARQLLESEANRVINAVAAAKADRVRTKSTAPLPYPDRLRDCDAFLRLKPAERENFVSRITLLDGNFNVRSLHERVEGFLTNFPKTIRSLMAERLIEWWDRRVAKSLCKQMNRQIGKDELQAKIQSLAVEHANDNLPDDFSMETPMDLTAEYGSAMEAQIKLVDGGASRLNRAALARWRAREQRAKWLSQNIGVNVELQKFDDALQRYWNDRHAPMCHDCKDLEELDKIREGKKILDWSHLNAHLEVPPPRPRWVQEFLAQGMYQQFADQLVVGWHPNFKERLAQNANIAPAKKQSKKRKTGV